MMENSKLFGLAFVVLANCDHVVAMQVSDLLKNFNKAPIAPMSQKTNLLKSISFTDNGKSATPETQLKVLDIVRSLELNSPPSSNLLSDEAQILDGVWYLHYTSPSDPALIAAGEPDQFPSAWKPQNVEDKISTKQSGYKGSVNAAGIKVDTSNKVVKQILDVKNSFVTNEIDLDWGTVCVGGPFRQSNNVPCRAVVSFQQCDIALKSGIILKLGFLFSILALLRGTKESGWLETTYIDSTMRIGRGNKGTMFVLTRKSDDVKP